MGLKETKGNTLFFCREGIINFRTNCHRILHTPKVVFGFRQGFDPFGMDGSSEGFLMQQPKISHVLALMLKSGRRSRLPVPSFLCSSTK